MNAAFWRLVATSWPFSLPRRRLIEEIGEEAAEAALRAGLLVRTPLEAEAHYPCRVNGEPGCSMRVVDDGPGCGLSAVCELAPIQCFEERIAPEDAWVYKIEPKTFLSAVARALGLPAQVTPEPRFAPCLLGDITFGVETVPVVFAPRPRSAGEALLQLAVERQPRVVIVLVADGAAVPTDARRRGAGTAFEWVALAASARAEDGLSLDLTDVAVRCRFRGVDLGALLGSRYDLVLDPIGGNYLWRGAPLDVPKRPQVAKLLHLLAERPGAFVPKRDIYVHVWPEEVSARTLEPRDPAKLQQRLRQLRGDLSAVLGGDRALDHAPEGVRLLLDPQRVHWLSHVG